MSCYVPNYDFYQTGHEDRHKDPTDVAVRKDILHTCVDLPPVLPVKGTGIFISIRKAEMFLSFVYKSPQRLWSDTDITDLLGLRNKSILAGDLNAKYPF
jgi:hypothetical protein